LKDINVKIREEDDKLVWSLYLSRDYVAKLGCKFVVEEGREGQHVWWWKFYGN
jgi:hypothetical protein